MKIEGLETFSVQSQEQAMELMHRMMDAARPQAVFGEPVTVEGQTIITAAEVTVGMGYGFGSGGTFDETIANGEDEAEGSEAAPLKDQAGGSGGGGGGGAGSRPVAAIIINQEGVHVEPIVDSTKIALAFFTALGSMFLMFTRMLRASRK